MNLKPVEGGDTPYLQQQNYSLAALNKRDQGEDPFSTARPAAATPSPPPANDNTPTDEAASLALAEIRMGLL
jgi:phage portal protein BeeE